MLSTGTPPALCQPYSVTLPYPSFPLSLPSLPPRPVSALLFSFCNPQSLYNLSELGLKRRKSIFPISIYISQAKNLKSSSTCRSGSICPPKAPVMTPTPCKSWNFNKNKSRSHVSHQCGQNMETHTDTQSPITEKKIKSPTVSPPSPTHTSSSRDSPGERAGSVWASGRPQRSGAVFCGCHGDPPAPQTVIGTRSLHLITETERTGDEWAIEKDI